jgi:hypothetical protein
LLTYRRLGIGSPGVPGWLLSSRQSSRVLQQKGSASESGGELRACFEIQFLEYASLFDMRPIIAM